MVHEKPLAGYGKKCRNRRPYLIRSFTVAKIPVAMQMYTLREDCSKDFIGTLKAVAKIGYAGVELAGTYGVAPKELGKILDDLGLKRAGGHWGVEPLEKEFDKTVEDVKALGSSFVTIPGLPGSYTEDAEAWKRTAALLSGIGQKLLKEGIQLSYHNHNHEFKLFGGKHGLDILYENSDPKALHAEIDTYWVQYAGVDPATYMKKVANRLSLVHIKDMADDDMKSFAEIGNGILDWDAIFAVAKEAGSKWLIVEQDSCKRPPLESAKISFENLKTMGAV